MVKWQLWSNITNIALKFIKLLNKKLIKTFRKISKNLQTVLTFLKFLKYYLKFLIVDLSIVLSKNYL